MRSLVSPAEKVVSESVILCFAGREVFHNMKSNVLLWSVRSQLESPAKSSLEVRLSVNDEGEIGMC